MYSGSTFLGRLLGELEDLSRGSGDTLGAIAAFAGLDAAALPWPLLGRYGYRRSG